MQTTPPGIHHLEWGLYLIYAIFNATFVPLVYYFVVETGGRSLEETDRWFEHNRSWLVHEADHGSSKLSANVIKLNTLSTASDQEAMMGDFELADDDESPVSPVRRRSFPTAD